MSLESMKEKLIGLYITEDLPVLSCIKPVDYFRARGGNVAPIDDNYSIRIVKQDGEDLPVTLDFNPTRRTEDAVLGLIKSENPALWESILFQEKVPANYTADIFGGKSWRIKDQFIYLTVGINNILNNRNFIIGGYEQSRFDFETKDVNRFPPRYFYAYGANYFIGLSFRL